jgi:cellobiose-specific phosphotransferase system component IIC
MNELYKDPSAFNGEVLSTIMPLLVVTSFLVLIALSIMAVQASRKATREDAWVTATGTVVIIFFGGILGAVWGANVGSDLTVEANSSVIAKELNSKYAVNLSPESVVELTGRGAIISTSDSYKLDQDNVKLGEGDLVMNDEVLQAQLWTVNGELRLFGADDGEKLGELPRR